MSEVSERRRAAVVAGHNGDQAVAMTSMSDRDPTVRAAALGALSRIGVLTWGTVLGVVTDPSNASSLRRRALTCAVDLPDFEQPNGITIAEDLVPVLADPDHPVVEVAAFVLGELQGPGHPTDATIDALSQTARDHSDSLCRESAVAALGSLGAERGFEAVLAAVDDIATIRRRAALALAAFDDDRVPATLERLTSDRDRAVRQSAEDLLAIIDPDRDQALRSDPRANDPGDSEQPAIAQEPDTAD